MPMVDPSSAGPAPAPASASASAASTPMPTLSRTNSMSDPGEMDGPDLLSSTTGLPLTDMLDTFLSPRIDLANRKWDAVKARRHQLRVDRLVHKWKQAQVVRLRDKISFTVGVLNLVASSLCFALRPHLVPTLYSLLALYFLPIRVLTYTKKKWHYFLFDFCYFLNTANLLFFWVFPSNKFLFTVCYCAAHGPLAFSVATWRNSLVFHSIEKMTSLFIHLYPPFVFTTLVHFTPREEAEARYPALRDLASLDAYTSFLFNTAIYLVWQLAYYELIVVRKKNKIATGERINSYSTMSKGTGPVAKVLGKAPERTREPAFMLLQFAYTILTTLPAPLVLFPSPQASAVFFLGIFTISIWNGASYYVEVFGRRFEKELHALRRELD